jgi:hypothetical protein
MDLEDYSMTMYKPLLQYAINGLLDINLFVGDQIKVAYLPVNQNTKTAELPLDYIRYTKIGYNDGGVIALFGLNRGLMMARDVDDCGNQTNENTSNCGANTSGGSSNQLSNLIHPYSGYYYAPHYRNGQFVGELFGGAGGRHNDGEFRIDHQNRQIVFNSEIQAEEIIIEYKSSGVSSDGSTCIPREYVPAIKAYVHWQRREYKDKVAQSVKDSLMGRYYSQFEQLKNLNLAFTLSEYLDSTRGTYKQTPKR